MFESSVIDLELLQNSLDSLLNAGTTHVVLSIPGNILFLKDLFMRADKGEIMSFYFFLRIKVGTLLGPVLLPLFRVCMTEKVN